MSVRGATSLSLPPSPAAQMVNTHSAVETVILFLNHLSILINLRRYCCHIMQCLLHMGY